VGSTRNAASPRTSGIDVTALDTTGIGVLAELVTQRLRAGGIVVAATHQPLEWPPDRADSLALS